MYKIWSGMKSRCLQKTNPSYSNYGGRGISIYGDWLEYESFRNWALLNGYNDEEDLSIERINVNGHYEPLNCEWIPKKKQSQNKRNTIYITMNGRTMTLKDWCLVLNLRYQSVWSRINRYGYTPEEALTKNTEKIKRLKY
ncbi:hypothetical protein QO179_24015 [Bacillus stercoris]|nr:hypothetical protein [Bacillus stercoris]